MRLIVLNLREEEGEDMRVWTKTKEYPEGKFLVVRRDGTVPRWPHFVLGARDPFAPYALRAYANYAEHCSAEPEFVASVRELARDFENYRAANGDGDVTQPPHRKDNQSVVKAMRHERGVHDLRVICDQKEE